MTTEESQLEGVHRMDLEISGTAMERLRVELAVSESASDKAIARAFWHRTGALCRDIASIVRSTGRETMMASTQLREGGVYVVAVDRRTPDIITVHTMEELLALAEAAGKRRVLEGMLYADAEALRSVRRDWESRT